MGHKVVGIDFGDRARIVRSHCKNGARVRLVREPNDPWEPKAVAVLLPVPKFLGAFGLAWKKIGYINPSGNKRLAKVLDRGDSVTAQVTTYHVPPGKRPRVSIDVRC
jgi:hypothetical protein